MQLWDATRLIFNILWTLIVVVLHFAWFINSVQFSRFVTIFAFDHATNLALFNSNTLGQKYSSGMIRGLDVTDI